MSSDEYYLRVRNDISISTFTRIIDSIRNAGFSFDIFTSDIQILDFRIYPSDSKEAEDIVAYINRQGKFPINALVVVHFRRSFE